MCSPFGMSEPPLPPGYKPPKSYPGKVDEPRAYGWRDWTWDFLRINARILAIAVTLVVLALVLTGCARNGLGGYTWPTTSGRP